MRTLVSFDLISDILEILDEHDINRELIEIPLKAQDPGGIEALDGGKIRLTVPASADFERWLDQLRPELLACYGVRE